MPEKRQKQLRALCPTNRAMRSPFNSLHVNQHATVAYFGNTSSDLYLIEKDKEFAPGYLLDLEFRKRQLDFWLRTAQVATAIFSIFLISWFWIGVIFDLPGFIDTLAAIQVWFFASTSVLALIAGLLLWGQQGSVQADIRRTRTHLRSLSDSYISGPSINDITPAMRDELWPLLAADAPEEKMMLAMDILNFVDSQYDNRSYQLEKQSRDKVAEIFTDATGLEITPSAWKQEGIKDIPENVSVEEVVAEAGTPKKTFDEVVTEVLSDTDISETDATDVVVEILDSDAMLDRFNDLVADGEDVAKAEKADADPA